ncbi:ABC-type amino acid transport substrate-binding protein [Arsukibacterium tuosuense]|uniref:ABC-type amino acid transport substrate-binding protein n=1 Tax=Arsukibacterium tuosuense TaxID=1323745 RepID=A0A285IZK7_9GAMM|nr:transporter substrate-binding domain-containing protein [Arsukibacterium tuosuense]SNY53398.1 ABC-type amino acid transport substrate-binding protein [Arsukibacterium tuosuense]
MASLKAVVQVLLIASVTTISATTVAKPQKLQGGVVQSFPGISVVNGKVQPEPAYGHAEIIACIEDELNARIEWQSLPTDRLLKLTHENQLDLIYPMGFTSERNSYLQASVWLTKDDDYFVFKTTTIQQATLQDEQLKSRPVGVKRGSPQLHYLQSNGFQHVHQVYEYQQLLPLLNMDRVDMLAVPQPLAEQLQAEMKADPMTGNLQLYNYYTRDAGFYLSPDFARTTLDKTNKAVIQCRQHTKTTTAIKQKS